MLYSGDASQARLAVQGMDRVVRLVTRKPMLGEARGEPRHKALINKDNGGPGGSSFSTGIQYVSGWFANPFPSYSLVWSGEPHGADSD